MRNLDIEDTRGKLLVYMESGLLTPSSDTPLPLLDTSITGDEHE